MADAGQAFERFKRSWDLSLKLFDESVGQIPDSARFGWRKTAGADDSLDLFGRKGCHFLRRVRYSEQFWRDEIDPCVGALGREEYGDEERVGIFMFKRDFGTRK